MRLAVLWNGLFGYLNACLRELASLPGTSMFVSRRSWCGDSPHDGEQYDWIRDGYVYQKTPHLKVLLAALDQFSPEMLLVASWSRPQYREICRAFRGRAVRVCCMDNQWRGSLKQWLGVLTAPAYIHRMFDAAFVAGERQAEFARRLGFDQRSIWSGFLSCDYPNFHAVYKCDPGGAAERKMFTYAGRLAPEKALDVLLNAYRAYRARTADPWPLHIAGDGPLRAQVEAEPGVVYHGFVQPRALPELFAKTGCFVLPSRFEPWGVVLHEATAAGIPVICTSSCGAAVHLVQDGLNGIVVVPGSSEDLARAMARMAAFPVARRREMSLAGASLSQQFTPARWATSLHEHFLELQANERGGTSLAGRQR